MHMHTRKITRFALDFHVLSQRSRWNLPPMSHTICFTFSQNSHLCGGSTIYSIDSITVRHLLFVLLLRQGSFFRPLPSGRTWYCSTAPYASLLRPTSDLLAHTQCVENNMGQSANNYKWNAAIPNYRLSTPEPMIYYSFSPILGHTKKNSS